jgi:hypothetical protein
LGSLQPADHCPGRIAKNGHAADIGDVVRCLQRSCSEVDGSRETAVNIVNPDEGGPRRLARAALGGSIQATNAADQVSPAVATQ